MRESTFFILLLVQSVAGFGQDYYVSPTGDTVPGAVLNYKEWAKNPTEIDFKVGNTGEIVKLNSFTSKSIVIGNSDIYISYHGRRITNAENINSKTVLRDDKELRKDTVDIFLLEIYRYKDIAVYKLFDNIRSNFYFARNGSVKELEYYEHINESNIIVPYAVYKAYLREQLFNENRKEFDRRIETLAYKERDLINFLAAVLGDELHISEKLRNKYPAEVFAGAGISMNAGKIENDAVADASYSKTTFSPSFEIGLRIYSQRNFGRVFLQPSISVFPSVSHSFRLKDNSEYKTKATLVTGHIAFGYFFQKKAPLAFYGVAGLGMTLVVNYNTQFINGTFSHSDHVEKVINKATIHPELGLIIQRSINIAVTGTLPYKLPVLSNLTYAYTNSQAGIVIRYIFNKGKK